MQVNQIIAVTTVLVAVIVSVVVYMNYAAGGDGHHWDKSKWELTMADGVTKQTWWVDLSQGIKVSTPAASMTIVQEFVGDKKYTYFTQSSDIGSSGMDCSSFTGMPAGVSCEDAKAALADDLAAMSSSKDSCTVEDAAVVVEQVVVKDGTLNVGGFIVTVADGKPTSIVSESGEVIATINSVETYSEDVAINGCSDGSSRHLMEMIEEGHARRLASGTMTEGQLLARQYLDATYMEMIPGAKDAASDRQLNAWVNFQAWASGTNWCGAGTSMTNTVCPDRNKEGDFYCYRHDHGSKAVAIAVAVRLGCDVDNSLAVGTSNFMAQAVFGAWGVAQFWGCDDFASYGCWKWFSSWAGGYWWYGDYCHGQTTRYGPGRYAGWSLSSCGGYQGTGCSFSHRWGFKDRRRSECYGYQTGPNNNEPGFFWGRNCPTGERDEAGFRVCN